MVHASKSEFGIPATLLRLSSTKSSIIIEQDLTEVFDTEQGFRQGGSLSCNFFNLIYERAEKTILIYVSVRA